MTANNERERENDDILMESTHQHLLFPFATSKYSLVQNSRGEIWIG